MSDWIEPKIYRIENYSNRRQGIMFYMRDPVIGYDVLPSTLRFTSDRHTVIECSRLQIWRRCQ
jgi:hypothetical protein